MTSTTNSTTKSTDAINRKSRRIVIVLILLMVAIGGTTLVSSGTIIHASPRSAQNREFYLFAQDLHFGDNQIAAGLTSDYIYSSTHIVVNKGDTVTIHFYNPTDQTHSFTMGTPYSNDVIVQAATDSLIQNVNITIVANHEGIFAFHCRFHPPQMIGSLVVQK